MGKGPFWYLVVLVRRASAQQGDPFPLRMDRIDSVRSCGHCANRDAAFDLDAFIRGEKAFE